MEGSAKIISLIARDEHNILQYHNTFKMLSKEEKDKVMLKV